MMAKRNGKTQILPPLISGCTNTLFWSYDGPALPLDANINHIIFMISVCFKCSGGSVSISMGPLDLMLGNSRHFLTATN